MFWIRFDKLNGFIRIYEITRHITSSDSENYDDIYNRLRYPKSRNISIAYIFSYFAKIKVGSCDSLIIEKRLNLSNVIILNKSAFNKDKSHYYYQIF